jgi:predicted acylesterase/phospholipase RssA
LVRRLLSAKKLELYIKEKLEEMKLNSSTSLAEFYDFSPRKITLNFNLINKKEQRLEIVNRFTRPNMPLWAAIVASASMPYLLPAFACDEEWLFSPLTDSRMRKLVHYFFDDEDAPLQTFYIAGNYVSTLPL